MFQEKPSKGQEVPAPMIDTNIRNETIQIVDEFCYLRFYFTRDFYHRSLRTIVGVNLGNRMSNEQLLQITGQPCLEDILRRNRLRWFGHVNRMVDDNGNSSLVKKAMFSNYPDSKRPANGGLELNTHSIHPSETTSVV